LLACRQPTRYALALDNLARDLDLVRREALRPRIGDLLFFQLPGLELQALALDLLLVALGGGQRELARQQVVARVPVCDLHDLAAAPKIVDVLSQYHFHTPARDC